MRLLLWFTLGFGAACGFCAYGRTQALLLLPVLVLLGALIAGEGRGRRFCLSILGILCGLFWFFRFETQTLLPVYDLDGITQETVIRCSSFPEETDYGFRAEGIVKIGGKNYATVCYLDDGEEVAPGKLISGPFRFRVTAPEGEKTSSYYQGEGIFLLAYQQDSVTVNDAEPSWRDDTWRLRQKILWILSEALPQDTAAFAKALLIGDSSDLDYKTKSDFSVSGISHIVAVSGLHVSILFSLVYLFSFRRRFLTALMGFPLLVLFASLTGFTPSVSRACIMSGLMMLSMLANREYDGAAALSFAGLVLLLVNPLVVTSVSYQLSFASVAGIFLFSSRLRTYFLTLLPKNRLFGYLAASAAVTLSATVLTAPLCALHFGAVSLAAVVTNLLVLWIVGIIFYGLMALCLLHGLWSGGALLLGKILTVLIRYVLLTADIIADFPLAAVYTRSGYIVVWLIFAYLLLGAFLVSNKKNARTLCCCTILGLCMALVTSWTEPMLDDVRFTVLDVGQGQCLLFQTEGKNFLVDCGGSNDAEAADAAVETLLSQGISKLDGLILTHYDRDHAGGISGLLSRVGTSLLILPLKFSEENYPADTTLYAYEDLTLSLAGSKIQILTAEMNGNDNENSLCILFDTKNCDILVTGDRSSSGEKSLLDRACIPDVDVLVAGHHGSKNATCEELLNAAQPEIVCISVGLDNRYGHPAPELLARLEQHGCTVYRTDLHGDITIRR